MRNHDKGTWRTCLFLILFVLIAIALRALPAATIGDYEVKRTDLLADIFPADGEAGTTPDAEAARRLAEAHRDTCPAGQTCIEDYATDADSGMARFYSALSRRDELGRPVRIAYYGDSFIEGDIITADLRAMLQEHFGGCGVGFVDIASTFIELRPTLHHKAAGWTDHSLLEKHGADATRFGLSGRYADGAPGASVTYKAVRDYARLDSFEVATLYLSAPSGAAIAVKRGSGEAVVKNVAGGESVSALTESGTMKGIGFEVRSGRVTAFGTALEGRDGITVDNFSLRGCSGTPLAEIPADRLKAFATLRPYDLIVLQFGLNVANKKQKDYSHYATQMKHVVERFRTACPGAAILIVSIGDREDKVNGTLATMPGVLSLLSAQQVMAAESGTAFWNLYEAMGGEGAIRRMAEAKPAEAGKDYTHINRRGGRRVATALYNALLHGYNNYEKTHEQH